jgi:hypothetical protein
LAQNERRDGFAPPAAVFSVIKAFARQVYRSP